MRSTARDPSYRVAVLGAGNGGLAAAAHLTSRGCSVRLYDLPEFASHFPAVRETGIRIFGAVPDATHRPDVVTTNMTEALDGVRTVLVIIPAYGQAAFTAALLPHLRDDHAVLLCPGAVGGALQLYNDLRAARPTCRAVIGEAANLIYAAKRVPPPADGAPAGAPPTIAVRINGIKDAVPTAAIPAARTRTLLDAFAPILPGFVAARDVLDTGLNNINVVIHPVLMLANLTRAEAAEEWFIFRNGFTPAVARLIEAVDRDRLAVVRALGLEETSTAQWMVRFYPGRMNGADLHEMLSSTSVFGQSVGPRSIRDRYLDEDVPYGLVPISSIASTLRLAPHCTDAVIALASVISGEDFARNGRTVERLGLAGLDRDAMLARVADGS